MKKVNILFGLIAFVILAVAFVGCGSSGSTSTGSSSSTLPAGGTTTSTSASASSTNPAGAHTTNLSATQDGMGNSTNPNEIIAYDPTPIRYVGFDSAGTNESYMRFEVSGITSAASVQQALLKIYVLGVAHVSGASDLGPITISLFNLASSFTGATVTWNTKPLPTGGLIVSKAISSSDSNGYVSFDVTNTVKAWINGTTINHGIGLYALNFTGDVDLLTFSSSHDPSNPPILEVTTQ